MPTIKKCIACESEFKTKPYYLKRGQGKYCSNKCRYTEMRKGKMKPCFICNKETYKTQKQLNGSKSGKFFCSKSCQTKWRNKEFIGPKHGNWKGGRYTYRDILERSKAEYICNLCKINDKRVLAVHHIDHNKLNNKVDNLAYLCHNCHHLVHHHKVAENEFMATMV